MAAWRRIQPVIPFCPAPASHQPDSLLNCDADQWNLEPDLEPTGRQGRDWFASKPRTPRRIMPVSCRWQLTWPLCSKTCIRSGTCKSHTSSWSTGNPFTPSRQRVRPRPDARSFRDSDFMIFGTALSRTCSGLGLTISNHADHRAQDTGSIEALQQLPRRRLEGYSSTIYHLPTKTKRVKLTSLQIDQTTRP